MAPGFGSVALTKRLNIQRRLAWSLCKDDTHNRREANPFFHFSSKNLRLPFSQLILLVDVIHHHDVRNVGRSAASTLKMKRQEDASDKPLLLFIHLTVYTSFSSYCSSVLGYWYQIDPYTLRTHRPHIEMSLSQYNSSSRPLFVRRHCR